MPPKLSISAGRPCPPAPDELPNNEVKHSNGQNRLRLAVAFRTRMSLTPLRSSIPRRLTNGTRIVKR
jgi:hypothetical protein